MQIVARGGGKTGFSAEGIRREVAAVDREQPVYNLAVVSMVVRQGMRWVAIGVAAGLAGALLSGKLLAKLLFEVHPYDPVILGAVVLVSSGPRSPPTGCRRAAPRASIQSARCAANEGRSPRA
jgi:hypothetical protein